MTERVLSWAPMLMFLLVLFATMVLAVFTVAGLLAYGILHPPRMTDGKALYLLKRLSPADLGIHYEELTFEVGTKPIRLKGWWMPAETASDRCVILVHGYADAKVGAIAWAGPFRDAGCNLLAIDLRAHGQSQGRISTGGWREHHDLRQVIDQLKIAFPLATRRLVLFGISAGALTCLAAAEGRDDLAGIILESPIESFATGMAEQLRLANQPAGALRLIALRFAELASRSRFTKFRASELIHAARCPVFAMVAEEDAFISAAERQSLSQSIAQHGGVWCNLPNAGHLMGYSQNPETYSNAIREFLSGRIFV